MTDGPFPRNPSHSNGEWVIRLVGRQLERLAALQGAVLKDRDPEALHQLRVSLRRLRATLQQFGPVLVLPAAVCDQRLARSVRRLGQARDLDVLRDRLEQELAPGLPAAEQAALKPVLRELKRERRVARERLKETLRSRSHLELVAQLQRWLREPRLTPLGREPLQHWLHEWLLPPTLQLALHPGWWAVDPISEAETLHNLRKQIKNVRYQLENLRRIGNQKLGVRISQLRSLQELLGELNDLAVLAGAIDQQLPHGLGRDLPALAALMAERRERCWQAWQSQAGQLHGEQARKLQREELNRAADRRRSRPVCSAIPELVAIRLASPRRSS
ncbi:MAG: CHAD domain-containing protein [Cyanobacteriota bacterium]|nr:CHAD domain-containing protein [Cyanobacteriota bacterium]